MKIRITGKVIDHKSEKGDPNVYATISLDAEELKKKIFNTIIREELTPNVCEDSGQAEWNVREAKKLAKAILSVIGEVEEEKIQCNVKNTSTCQIGGISACINCKAFHPNSKPKVELPPEMNIDLLNIMRIDPEKRQFVKELQDTLNKLSLGQNQLIRWAKAHEEGK